MKLLFSLILFLPQVCLAVYTGQQYPAGVSVTNTPSVSVTNTPSVSISNSPTVTGPLTNTQLRASSIPVTGDFYPATQPVSGTFWQQTQPVSGTFWQTAQPIISTNSLPVTGTFWQETQPVTGTFFQVIQPVSMSSGSISNPFYAIIRSSYQAPAGEAGAVRCVKADGSGFESCAGGGGPGGDTYTHIISTFSQSDPGYVTVTNQSFPIVSTNTITTSDSHASFPVISTTTLNVVDSRTSYPIISTNTLTVSDGRVSFPIISTNTLNVQFPSSQNVIVGSVAVVNAPSGNLSVTFPSAQSVNAAISGSIGNTSFGATQSGVWNVGVIVTTQTFKSISFSSTTTGTIIQAVGGKQLRVYAVKMVVSAAISVNFRDGASNNLEGAMPIVANGGFVEVSNYPTYLFKTTSGNSLDIVISGAGTASGRISYWEE